MYVVCTYSCIKQHHCKAQQFCEVGRPVPIVTGFDKSHLRRTIINN